MDKISILIVDDHPLFRQGLRNVLAGEADLDIVGEGGSGQETLELSRKLRPQVTLLDINVPEMNRLQVVRQIQTERTPTSVIMLTAYHDLEQELHSFRAGSHAYCPKDVTPRHLIQVVRWVAPCHYVVNDRVYDQQGLQEWLELARHQPACGRDGQS